jgi:RES domain-containing protein
MIVYRLSKKKFRNDISGKGAEIAGGRWNSIGNSILYTAENRALCTAEIAVHTPLGIVPKDYYLITIEIPKGSNILEVELSKLPKKWKTFPHLPSTKKVGDAFLSDNKFLIIKVPSAIIPGEFNFLLNPNHKDFKKVEIVKIEPFEFDKRLFDR